MYYLIYKITNTVNNKIYIGKHQTDNKDDDYMGSGKILKRAIEKYGIDKFTKEILFECGSLEEMNEKEADIVDEEFVARLDTYNVKLGGQGGWDFVNVQNLNNKSNQCYIGYEKGLKQYHINHYDKIIQNNKSSEQREKITRGLLKYYSEHKHQWVGRRHNDESKKKIGMANSIHQKGANNSNYGKVWICHFDKKQSISIIKTELEKYKNDGWLEGRIVGDIYEDILLSVYHYNSGMSIKEISTILCIPETKIRYYCDKWSQKLKTNAVVV